MTVIQSPFTRRALAGQLPSKEISDMAPERTDYVPERDHDTAMTELARLLKEDDLGMTRQDVAELRASLDAESISYGELALIESAFEKVPDDRLRDVRENAMASDMLDEIESFIG